MSSYDFETTVQVEDQEYTVTVEYTVTSWGAPESGPNSYGPGDPPEPPEFEITSIETEDGTEIKWDNLSEFDQNKIDQGIYKHLSEMDYSDYY